MKNSALTFSLWLLAGVLGTTALADEPSRALDLPATQIFSKGPNVFAGEVLEITMGRGSSIGWYVQAKQEDEVTVFVEYTSGKPLDQAYQLSFDGMDRFWEVPVTKGSEWGREKLGTFQMRAGMPLMVVLAPPSNRKYDHPVRFRKMVLEGIKPANLSLVETPKGPDSPDATPGFGQKLTSLHPALAAIDLRDEALTLRISGMAMRGARELIFSTWDGDPFSLALDAIPINGPPPFRRIAQGLSEPMGLVVSNGRIFVTEKNELTERTDLVAVELGAVCGSGRVG